MKQPYIYTMPESFLKDKSVPARWRVLGVINGFLINGGCFYGSNEWMMEQLACSEQTVSNAFDELEKLGEVRIERTRRTRKVYRTLRDPSQLGSETQVGSLRDPSWFGTNSVSNSEKNTSVATAPQDIVLGYETPEGEERPKSKPKYPNAKTVFSWFPNPEKSWNLNTTELKHAELLFERGEEKVKKRLRFVRENADADFMPLINKPSDLERKWNDLTAYAKRNN